MRKTDIVWPGWPADDEQFTNEVYSFDNGFGALLNKGREEGWRVIPLTITNGFPVIDYTLCPEVRGVDEKTVDAALKSIEDAAEARVAA